MSIEWSTTQIATDGDALALWQRIGPTGEDWEDKLDEIPGDGPIAGKLALAFLREGNFTCVKPVAPTTQGSSDCMRVPLDVDPPASTATLVDPCLRRLVALWAIAALDEGDIASAHDALRAIVVIPPPESELVAAALRAIPETDHARHLELAVLAFGAGHRELVHSTLGTLDEAHLILAAQKHHIDGALDLLAAETHRAVFLAAIADEAMHSQARAQAMIETVAVASDGSAKLPRDLRIALVNATRSKQCAVAAAAARLLVGRGEKKFGPSPPRARTTAPMMRSICVLASYEQLQQPDEASYLLGYVPTRGLELVTTTYDPYNQDDADGDGDPHTVRTTTVVPRNEVVLPELEDMIRGLERCTGVTCKSAEREFKFGWKPGPGGDLLLARLDVIERPPCPNR